MVIKQDWRTQSSCANHHQVMLDEVNEMMNAIQNYINEEVIAMSRDEEAEYLAQLNKLVKDRAETIEVTQ